jgi:Ca2+-binding RTX toxin-like protein
VGGTGTDAFVLKSGGSIGSVNGGAGLNRLDYSFLASPITVNLQTSTATAVGSFTNITQVYGSTAGGDTLIAPNVTNTWNITSANAGKIFDSVFGTFFFQGVENLTGGSGTDVFKFTLSGSSLSGVIDGGTGSNWLDYQALSAGVTVNLATGAATAVSGGVTNIQNVLGSQGNDNLTGNAQGNVLNGLGGSDTIIGGSGRSVLIGGNGDDTVTGGSDEDILIGGRTTFDASTTALAAILAEWQNPLKIYADRVTDMKSGAGNNLILNTTVLDDGGALDTLTGNAATLDWFFQFAGDTITDLNQPGLEQVN